MQERIEVNVYLEDTQTVKDLKQKLQEAEQRAFRMGEMYSVLETRYSNLMMINLEFLDLMKANGFKYRPGLERWLKDLS